MLDPLPVSRLDACTDEGEDEALVSAWLTRLDFDWGEATQGCRLQTLKKHEPLFWEGQAADSVYIVREGRVLLMNYSREGRERHLMILGRSGTVGDCGLFGSARYLVSARAAAPATVQVVATPTFRQWLDASPRLARQHMALAGQRLRIMMQHLHLTGPSSALRRVSHHLLGLASSYPLDGPQGLEISIRFTQQEMGHICGLSRVSVSTVFSQLEREAVIGRHRGRVVIRDPARLRQLARD